MRGVVEVGEMRELDVEIGVGGVEVGLQRALDSFFAGRGSAGDGDGDGHCGVVLAVRVWRGRASGWDGGRRRRDGGVSLGCGNAIKVHDRLQSPCSSTWVAPHVHDQGYIFARTTTLLKKKINQLAKERNTSSKNNSIAKNSVLAFIVIT